MVGGRGEHVVSCCYLIVHCWKDSLVHLEGPQNKSQKSLFLLYLLVGSGIVLGTPSRRVTENWRNILKEGPKRGNSQSSILEVSKSPGWPEFTMILSSLPGLFSKLHYWHGTAETPMKSGWLDSMTCFSNKLIWLSATQNRSINLIFHWLKVYILFFSSLVFN